jgi:hypothetical protein
MEMRSTGTLDCPADAGAVDVVVSRPTTFN